MKRLLAIVVVCFLPTAHVGAQETPIWPILRLDLSAPPFSNPYATPLIIGPQDAPSSSDKSTAPIAPHQRADLSTDATAVVQGTNRFGLNIFQKLSSEAKPDDNLLVSPFSISTALAMTYAGARGRTSQQMADVLGFSLPDDRLHAAYGQLIADLTAPRDGYQLSVANRLFGQQDYPFKQEFLDVTSTAYGAPLEQLDFRGNPDDSRNRINQWVADQTNNKIRDLLPPGSVGASTPLVLTNATYFNGKWKYRFDSHFTQDRPFYLGGATTQVPTMFQEQSFRYADTASFQVIELPYAGDDLSLVVMLPHERDGLESLERSMTPELWQSSLSALHLARVDVSLPKFTFKGSFLLSGVLQDMGMTDAFGLADFSGMVDPTSGQLSIGEVYHKTFIDVNEEGTEAAAATAVGIVATAAIEYRTPPEVFDADHPFLFALEDNHSGSILFLGSVADPGGLTPEVAAVPEPTSIILVLMGMAATVIMAKRTHSNKPFLHLRRGRPVFQGLHREAGAALA